MSIERLGLEVFESPELSMMHEGVVYLSAPSYNGNIQINSQRLPDDRTVLLVMKDELSVHVTRADGGPLQAEINHREEPFENEQGEYRLVQRQVFPAPVQSVRFVKKELLPLSDIWYTTDGWNGECPERLQKFAELIGSVSLSKQRKSMTGADDTPQAIIAYPTQGGTYSQSMRL